ncbi:MAG: hypothetical protein A3G21_10165 [Acidobacteria bacterium RIFCSPLOWO2_12_FULL_66_21]|nr:MAG: hypothetical protein A3G21_10165 [Acidobacteria bacterium RIFCSPLOWO2_12_FULL_66_21]
MFLLQHTAMATVFEIRCASPDERLARQAASAAFDVVDRLEQQLSKFIGNSDISRINHLSAGESTVVGYDTMQCLQLASLIHAETGGAFDVAIGTGFDDLVLFPGESVVFARADNVRLDLGAIGKGYAVDRVADTLEDWEVDRVLIDAGLSSVLALEPPSGWESWPLTLSEPGDTGVVLAQVAARQRALGASGIRKRDHILNPRDHTAVRTRSAAWVSAPRHVLAAISRQAGVDGSPTAAADALSTAFMINEVGDIAAYCRRHPELEVWILEDALRHFSAMPGATPG